MLSKKVSSFLRLSFFLKISKVIETQEHTLGTTKLDYILWKRVKEFRINFEKNLFNFSKLSTMYFSTLLFQSNAIIVSEKPFKLKDFYKANIVFSIFHSWNKIITINLLAVQNKINKCVFAMSKK